MSTPDDFAIRYYGEAGLPDRGGPMPERERVTTGSEPRRLRITRDLNGYLDAVQLAGPPIGEQDMFEVVEVVEPGHDEQTEAVARVEREKREAWAATVTERVREIARPLGYAIGEHGTRHRDLDLIAVPWAEVVGGPDELASAIAAELGEVKENRVERPHGRLGYTVVFATTQPHPAFPRYIDLSVMPTPERTVAAVVEALREEAGDHQGHIWDGFRNSANVIAERFNLPSQEPGGTDGQ